MASPRWKPPGDEFSFGKETKFYSMEAMRVMACFPHGTTFEKDASRDMTRVTLPNKVRILVTEHLLTLRMGGMLTKLQVAMWNEFIDRAADCAPGTELDMNWLDEVRFEHNRKNPRNNDAGGSFAAALDDRDG